MIAPPSLRECGALAGFIVAATPFTMLGINSGLWAIPVGLAASALVERRQLLEFWRRGEGNEGSGAAR